MNSLPTEPPKVKTRDERLQASDNFHRQAWESNSPHGQVYFSLLAIREAILTLSAPTDSPPPATDEDTHASALLAALVSEIGFALQNRRLSMDDELYEVYERAEAFVVNAAHGLADVEEP